MDSVSLIALGLFRFSNAHSFILVSYIFLRFFLFQLN